MQIKSNLSKMILTAAFSLSIAIVPAHAEGEVDISPWEYKPSNPGGVSASNDLRADFKYDFSSKGSEVITNSGNTSAFFKSFYTSNPFAWSFDFLGAAIVVKKMFFQRARI